MQRPSGQVRRQQYALREPILTRQETREGTEATDDELLVRGPLTIKGQTKIVELPVRILGVMDVAPTMRDMLAGVGQIASFQTRLTLIRTSPPAEVTVPVSAAPAPVSRTALQARPRAHGR